MKIIVYLIYFVIFTYFYCVVNKKLTNKWIFIMYPLIFIASIMPLKWLFNYLIPMYGQYFMEEWVKVILFMIAGFTLFNISYGFVNLLVNAQVNFHQTYGKPNVGHIKSFIDNQLNIKNFLHFFFYTGGTILIAIVVYKSGI